MAVRPPETSNQSNNSALLSSKITEASKSGNLVLGSLVVPEPGVQRSNARFSTTYDSIAVNEMLYSSLLSLDGVLIGVKVGETSIFYFIG